MINSLQTYLDCGRKAGKARKQHDASLSQTMHNWFNRAVRLESEQDKECAKEQFLRGYREQTANY